MPNNPKPHAPNASGLAIASRVVTEFIAAIGVAVIIGLAIDRWLDTTPWATVIFVCLGFGAAILNVARLSNSLQTPENHDA